MIRQHQALNAVAKVPSKMRQLVILLVLTALASAKTRYDRYKVLRVFPTTRTHAELLMEWDSAPNSTIGLWREPSLANRPVNLHVPAESLLNVIITLDTHNIRHEVIAEDLQQLIDENYRKNAEAKAQAGDTYHFTDYRTYDEINQWVTNRINTCPSGLTCERINLGNSYEGRALFGMKVSSGSGRRAFWYDAGIHAREWISPSTCMWVMNELLNEYAANDTLTRSILARWDFYFLPVQNVDGYSYTHDELDGDRLWRKTRQEYPGEFCIGCDANRNFHFQWRTIGASGDPCSDTYAGPFPYSEPCTELVESYITNLQDNNVEFEVFLTTHSYGQLMLLPYGYTADPPDNYDELYDLAEAGALALFSVHGTVYDYDSASIILYPSSGTSRDWAHGAANIRFVYTFELRDTGLWGFLLPPEQIIPTGQETWAGVKEMARVIISGQEA